MSKCNVYRQDVAFGKVIITFIKTFRTEAAAQIFILNNKHENYFLKVE